MYLLYYDAVCSGGTRKAALSLLLSYVILLTGVICGVKGVVYTTIYTLVGAILCVISGRQPL